MSLSKLSILLIVFCLFLVVGCSSKLLKDQPIDQSTINKTTAYYSVLNGIVKYLEEKKTLILRNEEGKILVHPIAEIPTWNSFCYESLNFHYHYSVVDTTDKYMRDVKVDIPYLRNVCRVLDSSFSLSMDKDLYEFDVSFSAIPFYEYQNLNGKRPILFSPVIERNKGLYSLFVVFGGYEERGIKIRFKFRSDKPSDGIVVMNYSIDAQDGFGWWAGKDYVRHLCR